VIISPTLLPSRKLLQDSDIAPHHLAITLTLLNGDKYKAIFPSDYIVHFGKYPGSNSVKVTCTVNNQIILWVKQSVLHYDKAKLWAQHIEFFLKTAQVSRLTWVLYIKPTDQIAPQECWKPRKYGLLITIGITLHLVAIKHLKLTKQSLSSSMRHELRGLKNVFDRLSNYCKVLNQAVNLGMHSGCIPWLGENSFVNSSIGLTLEFICC